MHSNSYSVNVACLCSKNLIKSLEEIKSFFTFKMFEVEPNSIDIINKEYDAIIIDSDQNKNISFNSSNHFSKSFEYVTSGYINSYLS